MHILHCGFLETRMLARAKRVDQLIDLSDVMELASENLHARDDKQIDVIRMSLQQYQDKYSPPMFDYVALLSGTEPIPKLKKQLVPPEQRSRKQPASHESRKPKARTRT
jgi:hypothetical protein